MYENSNMIDWTLRVPVVDMAVSKNYAIFLLGNIKSADVKRLILLEEVEAGKMEEIKADEN